MPRYGNINERRHQLHEVIRLSGINLVINDLDMPLIIKVASIPKERIQVYQGVIISTHNNENPTNATITVRKMFQGGGIEKVFLLNSPWLKTVEVLTSAKIRRGKLYYLRDRVGKSARLKRLFT